MKTLSLAQAKAKLSGLIDEVTQRDERVTITKRGIPVVEIVRKAEDSRPKRIFGVLGQKKIVIDPDWALLQE